LSYNNLSSTSTTLVKLIWIAIKDDKELSQIIKNEEQISCSAPGDSDKAAQLSIFLYNPTELPAMRNQPRTANEPQTVLYLKLHYLITPLTRKPQTDQILLGKIVQLFSEKPILRGSDLKGSIADNQSEMRITLDTLSIEEQNSIWTMLQTPYKLSASYNVIPIEIKSDIKEEAKPVNTKTHYYLQKQK
jgi:hypothetical protein